VLAQRIRGVRVTKALPPVSSPQSPHDEKANSEGEGEQEEEGGAMDDDKEQDGEQDEEQEAAAAADDVDATEGLPMASMASDIATSQPQQETAHRPEYTGRERHEAPTRG
jgi:hypothetical protein